MAETRKSQERLYQINLSKYLDLIFSTTFASTVLLFFSSRRRCRSYPLSRRTLWPVRAFRDGDYAGGIGHGIGATLSFGGAATSILGSAPGNAGNLARKGGNVIDDSFWRGFWA